MFAKFEKYDLPNFGYVRLPEITLTKEEKTKVGLSDEATNYDFLRKITELGFREKGLHKKPNAKEYQERINMELALVEELSFTDYFLLVWRVIEGVIEFGTFVDYGRGSCVASLVFYCLNVTGVDPIDKKLLFSRFMSKVRAKKKVIDGITYIDGSLAPDVDINASTARDYVVKWLNQTYPGKIAKICTLSTLTGKMLIKDVFKTFNEDVKEEDVKKVSDLIEKHFGIVQDIEDTYKESPAFQKWADNNKLIYQTALQLRELIRQKSVHASGYLVSYHSLDGFLPLELNKAKKEDDEDKETEKEVTVGYEMNDVSNFALKLDLLGLITNQIIKEVLNDIPEKLEDIELDENPVVYNQFQHGELLPYGLYQISADCALRVLNDIKPKNIFELSDVNAIARPGALSFLKDYVLNNVDCPHKVFEKTLKLTRNLCLYQEQAIQMAVGLGFTPEEGEIIRRCVTGDTLFVSKTRGFISIRQLLKDGYKNDLFLVMDECGQKKWKKITEIWSNGFKLAKTVRARNGLSINVTGKHQFLTDTGWKAQKYLEKDIDYLVTCKEIEFDGQDLITSDLALIIGGLVTEGYFIKDVSQFTNFDKQTMEIFCNSFLNEFGHLPSISPDGKVAHINKADREVIHKFLNYGKSKDKKLPDIMMGMTKETTRKFLSFILSCEGGVIKQGKFEICSKSPILIQQIKLLLLRFGIRTCYFPKVNKKYGKFYYLNIGEYSILQRLKEELTCNFEKRKIEELDHILMARREISHTLDIIPPTIVKKFKNQYGFDLEGDNKKIGSGYIYKNSIGRDKFYKLIQHSNDKYWNKLATGSQEYSIVTEIEHKSNEIEVFDFTVDEDTPFIVANGIVIHNCIGKKKVEEVKEWKEKIYKKSEENGFSKEVADLFWKIVDDSSKYQFNLSHSVATSYLSALTVYLKYKYPIKFYLACLRNIKKGKFVDHVSKIQKELKYFKLKFLPPDILKSQIDFSIEDGSIRFGLGRIKGISNKTIEKLNKFKHAYSNKFEIFQGANEAGIDIRVLNALIKSGAIGGYSCTRSRIVLEAQTWNILTDKEKSKCLQLGPEYGFDLLKIVVALNKEKKDEKGKPFIKDSRFETIKNKYLPFKQIYLTNKENEKLTNWFFEHEMLGFSHSTTITEIFKEKLEDIFTIEEIKQMDGEPNIRFCGKVMEIQKSNSKKGKAYLRVVVEDDTALMTCLIFGEKIDEHEDLNGGAVKEGDIVVVRGRKKPDAVFADIIATQKGIVTKMGDTEKKEA